MWAYTPAGHFRACVEVYVRIWVCKKKPLNMYPSGDTAK